MASNITIVGNLTADAKTFTAKDGSTGYSLQIAENYFSGGEKKAHFWTAFFRFMPEKLLPYLTKGQGIMISGQPSIEMDEYNGRHSIKMLIQNPTTPSLIASSKQSNQTTQAATPKQHTPPPTYQAKPQYVDTGAEDYTPF